MKLPAFALSIAFLPWMALSSHGADAKGTADHPQVKRITGSEILWSKVEKFDELTLALEPVEFDYNTTKFKDTKQQKVEGAHTTLYYKMPEGVSTLEAVRQYEGDLKQAGFETLFTGANDKIDDGFNRFVTQVYPKALKMEQFQYLHEFNHEDQRYSALKGQSKNGGEIYVAAYAFHLTSDDGYTKFKESHGLKKGDTVVRVDVLEAKPMEARMTVVKAAEITDALSKTGRIAIYGVYFDTDKADLKPESNVALTEMANAIKAGNGRKFLIVGHTDNQGEYGHNQTLSQKRAAAVTAELTSKYGVSAGSVIPVGVGMAAPVAANTEEAGRTKNRRVEIVAM